MPTKRYAGTQSSGEAALTVTETSPAGNERNIMAASTTPTATINTFLMHFEGATARPTSTDLTKAKKVCDITSYPAMGGNPNQLDVTTLSDSIKRSINGLKDTDQFEFGSNYIKGDKVKLDTLEKKGEAEWWGLFLGAGSDGEPDGHDGIFTWQGGLTSYLDSGDVDAARTMKIVVSMAAPVELMDNE